MKTVSSKSNSRMATFWTKRQKGSILAMMATLGVLMVAFFAVGIYLGVLTYLQQELQKAATVGAQVGATNLYDGFSPEGEPIYNAGSGQAQAGMTLNTVIQEVPLLANSNTQVINSAAAGDVYTVQLHATMPAPILTLVGLNVMEVDAEASAQALKYCPTVSQGPITLIPPGTKTASLAMDFATSDVLPEAEIKVIQEFSLKGYTVEGCSGGKCHTLSSEASATPLESCRTATNTQADNVVYGTTIINLAQPEVSKISSLQFKDDMVFDSFSPGCGAHSLDSTPTTIDAVEVLGFSGLCFGFVCPVPKGFAKVTEECG